MWPQIWETLKPRLKSLAWRALVMFLLGVLALVAGVLKEINLPEVATLLLGLIINEVTKWLNNHTDMFGARLK